MRRSESDLIVILTGQENIDVRPTRNDLRTALSFPIHVQCVFRSFFEVKPMKRRPVSSIVQDTMLLDDMTLLGPGKLVRRT